MDPLFGGSCEQGDIILQLLFRGIAKDNLFEMLRRSDFQLISVGCTFLRSDVLIDLPFLDELICTIACIYKQDIDHGRIRKQEVCIFLNAFPVFHKEWLPDTSRIATVVGLNIIKHIWTCSP